MSFSFDPDVEMQDPEWLPAKVAKTANSSAEAGGTRDKLATLATSHPQNSKSEGPGIEAGYPPPGTFLEADERCPEAMAKPGPPGPCRHHRARRQDHRGRYLLGLEPRRLASLRRALSRSWVHRDADRRTSQASRGTNQA
jgi:hypothetical protein